MAPLITPRAFPNTQSGLYTVGGRPVARRAPRGNDVRNGEEKQRVRQRPKDKALQGEEKV